MIFYKKITRRFHPERLFYCKYFPDDQVSSIQTGP